MSLIENLQTEIESLRNELYRLVGEKGSFADPEVETLSRKLDELIVKHDQLKAEQEKREFI